jgi:prepilin-type N-terminal cleavage/methylation domain-containing protein
MGVRKDPADAGFTLIEVLAALAVVGIVMTAVTTFFVRSMVTVDIQAARQAAIQVAADGMEQLRAVPGALALKWITDNAAARTVSANGLDYTRSWDVPPAGSLLTATVHVSWPSRGCAGGTCNYSTSTLISTAMIEPIFEPSA